MPKFIHTLKKEYKGQVQLSVCIYNSNYGQQIENESTDPLTEWTFFIFVLFFFI